ncbi:MAG: MBL fold metallo-hydrolase, partial [Kiritimatiellae bacterium]|nr:MBL fold metallo-hydrolase [Kiritimatiellia bacterium]
DVYKQYRVDGDTRGLASLEKLEHGFEKIFREARETKVENTPAVWSVYNMGYVVKTPGALFSIDLVHRRAAELAPLLDFALITHNHSDHWRPPFYEALDSAGKTVYSNFLSNYGAADWRKGGDWAKDGGYTRAEKTFTRGDVEIHTSLVDHNGYLVDFTTAFEIRCGGWTLYHTGDCGWGSERKLHTVWGRPDLWLFFPGCGIDVKKAAKRVKPKRIVFGHMWELAHEPEHRLGEALLRPALAAAREVCADTSIGYWGERLA